MLQNRQHCVVQVSEEAERTSRVKGSQRQRPPLRNARHHCEEMRLYTWTIDERRAQYYRLHPRSLSSFDKYLLCHQF